MASYTERSGAVRVTVRLGKGERETATFDTRAEAESWAADMERKKAVGLLKPRAGSRATVGDLLEAYEVSVASRQDSARWNKYRINRWLLDPISKLAVTDVTTHEINEWIDRRMASVSGPTANRELNLLSAAFTYAVRDRRWITVNPCHGARRPENGKPRDRALLTLTEIGAIKVATGYDSDPDLVTKTARVGACFLLALETGMRSGEILRLRPIDYDKVRRVIRVAALERGGRKAARSGRTSRNAGRDVPLTGRAMELLDQLLIAKPVGDYIVGITDRQRDALWRKATARSGVEGLTFHDSKHEAATKLSRFLDVLTLSHAIGTKDVRLLRDTYYNQDASRAAMLLPESISS